MEKPTLYEFVRDEMLVKGLALKDFPAITGKNKGTITRLKTIKSRPQAKTYKDLSLFLDVSVRELISYPIVKEGSK